MLLGFMLIFIFVLVIYERWKNNDIYKLGRQLGSRVWTLPILGHSYMFIGSSETHMKSLQIFGQHAIKNQNGVTAVWHGNYLYTMISDPVAAETVLKTSLEKDDIVNLAKTFLGNGSIFAPVSIWKLRRKVLVPAFCPKNLKHFLSIFIKQSKQLVEQLNKAAGTGVMSVWNYFTAYTMDSIAEATLGYDMEAQKNSGHPFLYAFDDGLRHSAERIVSPWLHSDLVYCNLPVYKKLLEQRKYLWGFIAELIQSKRIQMEKEEKLGKDSDDENNRQNFLELLIKSSGGENGYTNVEIIEELMVIMIAGNDTSAVAASYICVMLSRHPEVQAKVFEELQEIFGDSDRPVSSEDLPKLKYLDAVIRETLRLYSPVPIIARKVEKEIVLPSGIKLVPGTGVIVNIWAIHRNPRYWGEDAEVFRPERFFNLSLKHPAAFMPFSFGPRNCVGYQFAMTSLKTVLSTVIRRYRILPANDLKGPYPPLRLKFDLMMKDVDNYQIQLELRNKVC